MAPFGALAAFGSALTWAFSSVRYSQVSRDIGSLRVNLTRALVVGPFYLAIAAALHEGRPAVGVTVSGAASLVLSVVCSYVLADSLFFVAARRIGVSTALSIASTYPLWAALVGVVFRGEPFGPLRLLGTVLCVAGVTALVRLTPASEPSQRFGRSYGGVLLAAATSVLWAGNSVAVKYGSGGLDVAQVNGVRYSFALLMLAFGVTATRQPVLPNLQVLKRLLPAIVADGILGSSFYVCGLAHSDLAVGATLSSLAPLISVPIAIAAGEDRWNPGRVVAVAMTVGGSIALVSTA
jgi:drug/metabolite transporter (DMT)-like permease